MKRVLALLLMVCILCAGWVAASAASLPVPFSPGDGLFFDMPKEEALALIEAEGWQFDYGYGAHCFYYINIPADQYIAPKYRVAFDSPDNGEKVLNVVEYIFALSYEDDLPPHFVTMFDDLEQKLISLYGTPADKKSYGHRSYFIQGNIVIWLEISSWSTYDGKPYHILSLFCYIDRDSPIHEPPPPPSAPNTTGF